MDIRIVDRQTAEQLCSNKPQEIQHLLSITSGKQQQIRGFKNIKSALWLKFSDNNYHGPHSPQRKHVQQIIEFGRKWQKEGGALLIHCEAGISRSTASAFIILADMMGPGKEEKAMQEVFNIRPQAWPNKIICEFADKILKRNGMIERICGYARHNTSGLYSF